WYYQSYETYAACGTDRSRRQYRRPKDDPKAHALDGNAQTPCFIFATQHQIEGRSPKPREGDSEHHQREGQQHLPASAATEIAEGKSDHRTTEFPAVLGQVGQKRAQAQKE